MNRVSFVDNNGNDVYGVVAFRGNNAVAGAGGESFLTLEDGTYTFKLLGFKDWTSDVYGDEEIALEEVAYGFQGVEVFDFYQHKTWILALLVVVVGVAYSKLRK